MKFVKKLKPGQLFTFGSIVYQVRKHNRFSPCYICDLCQGNNLECIDTYSKGKGSLNEFCINNTGEDCYLKRVK